jgi:hypothetical protein
MEQQPPLSTSGAINQLATCVAAHVTCVAALAAYEKSCAMSDSADGDDLPGLLANWGVGLTTAAGCVPVRKY